MDDEKEYNDEVMIALLPITTDWCRIKVPHMTLVYAGEMDDLGPTAFNDLAKDASSIAAMAQPLTLKVMGLDVFGDDDEEKVDVLKLQPTTELWAMRRFVERWNASKHPFNPHVTVGPTQPASPIGGFRQEPPGYIAFDRVCLGWGDEYLPFRMKR